MSHEKPTAPYDVGLDCASPDSLDVRKSPAWKSDHQIWDHPFDPSSPLDERKTIRSSVERVVRMSGFGKLIFYGFVLLVLIVVLSRAASATKVGGSLFSGINSLGRTFSGQNAAGTGFLPPVN